MCLPIRQRTSSLPKHVPTKECGIFELMVYFEHMVSKVCFFGCHATLTLFTKGLTRSHDVVIYVCQVSQSLKWFDTRAKPPVSRATPKKKVKNTKFTISQRPVIFEHNYGKSHIICKGKVKVRKLHLLLVAAK